MSNTRNNGTLSSQVALVTGANRGIGRQISLSLAGAGALVVAGARNVETLTDLADEVSAAGGRCETVALDVTDSDAVATAVDGIIERHGRIDLLVNNAGIGGGSLMSAAWLEPTRYPRLPHMRPARRLCSVGIPVWLRRQRISAFPSSSSVPVWWQRI